MNRDFPSSEKKTSSIVAREALAIVATTLLMPFGLLNRSTNTPRQLEQRTVVLVHGCFANSSCLLPLKMYLRTHGIKQVLSYDYQAGRGLESAAIGLKNFLRQHIHGGRIDFVCHSYGGLVARAYLQYLRGYRRVDRCITLGTPHRGTYNAYWLPSRVGNELRPNSRVLSRLSATHDKAKKVRFLSIIAGSDNIVIPRVFSKDQGQVLHLPDVGHVGLLYSPRAFRIIVNQLLGETTV